MTEQETALGSKPSQEEKLGLPCKTSLTAGEGCIMARV
jgi:hypothetical protein